jgi:hypothetical protein
MITDTNRPASAVFILSAMLPETRRVPLSPGDEQKKRGAGPGGVGPVPREVVTRP